ncbi:hypothetical protein C1646_662322 [Rhizophagus diaphanus]|nr:hypothetical protein C1646_662322 [Rhizophagus diaphanus] [Rhizophagus sp. MUCL 43196]
MTTFYPSLSNDFSLILIDSDDFNVIIQVGENLNMKEFQAHTIILRARSPYFKSALSTRWVTKKNNIIMFHKPNITPIVFEMILKYIYTGVLDLSEQLCEDILGLLAASDELLLEELVEYLQDYLIEQKKSWVQQNSVLILNKFASCKKLHNFCFETICENSQPFITSKTFFSLNKDILYSLLERDDFQIEDDVAWDCLIKWGIEQTPGLRNENSVKSNWNDENYEALKNTLNQFIPLIRFVGISPIDFLNKVQPYKDIFPDNIYKEIEDFYFKGVLPTITILPPRIGIFESKIIKPKLANIIVNWINKKDYRTINDSYCKFKLIYHNTNYNRINNHSFKTKCNGQVASLVLIKPLFSKKVFGGYSSIGFNSIGDNNLIFKDGDDKYYYSSDNFIFSFENGDDTQNMKISCVLNHSKAISDEYNYGFNFGGSLYMKNGNLCVNNKCGNYNDNLGDNGNYMIKEIETFIVDKQLIHLSLLNQ